MRVGAPPLGAPPYLVGPLVALRRQLQLYILAFGEKKIREKKSSCFTIRSCRQALNLSGGLIWSPFGAPERGIRRRRHHQPSSITNFMMLTACMSNSIVGLLDGDGLDEIYHVIDLVLLRFDP